jgi:nicotinamidase-related amidase
MQGILIIVDMQRDFVDGALGTPEAASIVPAVARKIRAFEGDLFVTLDTHDEQYPETSEGMHLPIPHCIKGTEGWLLDRAIEAALKEKSYTAVEKPTFGSIRLPELIRAKYGCTPPAIELCGLCTDICVISNALLLKAHFPETKISVDPTCCAGVTPESHAAALTAMKMCQITM